MALQSKKVISPMEFSWILELKDITGQILKQDGIQILERAKGESNPATGPISVLKQPQGFPNLLQQKQPDKLEKN